ncbi:uncharacterized protein [Primulina eburnea]|uniref:uncharacterized protein n=1 Tax=Primulina eburnea TaxID=1245227 RepID=UPI003C6C7913
MVESSRLTYIRMNQKQLRCEMYKGLHDALLRGETNPSTQGKRIILPSTFTGGARYMIQNYQDAMAICKWAGYPDLFITFTCNPKWPEIVRFVEGRGLKPEDRPDIVCKIFKIKIDALIKDLRKNKIFGNVKAGKIFIFVIYTVEFQKRGLPHAHILLFLCKEDKYPTPEVINGIISAEIPNEKDDPIYYNAVRDLMMHSPCGEARKKSPCMTDGRYTKNFPKKFVEVTSINEDGYPVYRRRDNARTILKNGVNLDNRFVVPHNRYLLIRYGAHINVEWCNQSRAIKYLFKYINKGHDRVTASFYQSLDNENFGKTVDEVNMYYDCRYISPCEAAWRIFGFEIQYRDPPVELRGATCYDEISIVNGVQYRSFRDACYALELELNEDQIKSQTLVEIEKLLRSYGNSLRGFQSMLFPSDQYFQSSQNSLIHDEMRFDRRVLFGEHHNLLNNLNDQKLQWYSISSAPWWKNCSFSLFNSFNPTEESTCNIKQGSPLAELIVKSKLIIWDEAPMTHKFCFEALDKSMKDIMRFVNPSSLHMPFRGKTVVFGGDFRQILHVIPKGSRHDIVLATINSLYLWRHCKVLRLTKNMRLRNLGSDQEYAELKKFSDWIANLGDGKIGEENYGYATIDIPDELLLKDYNDPIATIVESTYPLFGNTVSDATYFQQKAILAPTLDVVQSVNEYMISMNHSNGKLYLSSDTTCHSDKNNDLLNDVHTPEFLNAIRCSGVPNHELNLKVGTPVMLLRNIDHSLGLCNGTRLILTRLGNHVLEGKIITGTNAGHKVIIPDCH